MMSAAFSNRRASDHGIVAGDIKRSHPCRLAV